MTGCFNCIGPSMRKIEQAETSRSLYFRDDKRRQAEVVDVANGDKPEPIEIEPETSRRSRDRGERD